MELILVTFDTFQLLTSELKLGDERNNPDILVTFSVFQLDMFVAVVPNNSQL
jgi:hypothetical protein